MITSTNISPITFTGKPESKKAQDAPDTSIYPALMQHHDFVSIALDTESEKENIIGLHINVPGKLPITIWKPYENNKEILISDHNFRNGTPFVVKTDNPNYGRIKGLLNHHIKNYQRNKNENTDKVAFTGALKAQALLTI